MAKRAPSPKYNTPAGTLRYPHLTKPDTRFKDEGGYKADVSLDGGDPAVLELVEYLTGLRDAAYDE